MVRNTHDEALHKDIIVSFGNALFPLWKMEAVNLEKMQSK